MALNHIFSSGEASKRALLQRFLKHGAPSPLPFAYRLYYYYFNFGYIYAFATCQKTFQLKCCRTSCTQNWEIKSDLIK